MVFIVGTKSDLGGEINQEEVVGLMREYEAAFCC